VKLYSFTSRATWGALLCLSVFACESESAPPSRKLNLHLPQSCKPQDSETAYAVFYGFGDYEPTVAAPSSEGTRLSERIDLLGISRDARAIVADVATLADRRTFRGLSYVGTPQGDVDLLLWPDATQGVSACRLSGDFGSRTQGSLGMVTDSRALYTGGQTFDGSPRTFVVTLTTGKVEVVPSGLVRRLSPTVSRFGENGLVAGGSDPESGLPIASAEIWNASAQDFSTARVELSAGRAEHAAVTLQSGAVLLVGGKTETGATRSLELIEPSTQRSRAVGVAQLELARKSPVAIALRSGETIVLGGQDSRDNPVPDIEWISADGAQRSRNRAPFLVSRELHAVPLLGGGALIVVDGDDAERFNVWRVSEAGSLAPVGRLPMRPGASFFLFPGVDDNALLFVDNTWYGFDPWAAVDAFVRLADAPLEGPTLGSLPLGTPDLGLVAWLDDRTAGQVRGAPALLAGLRFAPEPRGSGVLRKPSVKTSFGTPGQRLLDDGTDGLVPDRPASRGFVRGEGLLLAEGETATVAHYTYQAFSMALLGNPDVVLRTSRGAEFVVGASSRDGNPACAFRMGESLTVSRSGAQLRVNDTPCVLPFAASERVQIAVRGGAGGSVVRSLSLKRAL
jgi:hypothetical protein